MYPGLTLQASQALVSRLEMEAELRPGIVSGKGQNDSESWITRLYGNALSCGMVRSYDKHGIKFEYALVSAQDIPDSHKVHGRSFSHCLCNKFDMLMLGSQYALEHGSWLLFVVYDARPLMPDYCLEYAAVRECGHRATLGNDDLATKLELMIAEKEHNLSGYLTWLKENYPSEFAEVSRFGSPPEALADDFREVMAKFFRLC